MTINLIDARRGLHDKCLELFANKNIAEQIYCHLCDGIEDCEEAEPVKHGRWTKKESKRYWWYECSECGSHPPLNRYGGEWLADYCPNCGAKMDESTMGQVKRRDAVNEEAKP